ncbi:uncharacterized protein N7479_003771, partial [Penicillium vulpinum]|uniref:uncharacterized protein n=1 Tax=Penicillium vulpinum TaxID=29845 RepID=UPI00254983CD
RAQSFPEKGSPRSLIWTPPAIFSSPLPLPFFSLWNSILYNSFVSFVWVIVRLYFPARHALFARALISRCSLSRSDLTPLEAFIV